MTELFQANLKRGQEEARKMIKEAEVFYEMDFNEILKRRLPYPIKKP